MTMKAFHYTILLVCMFCAQAYKQARWGDIKRLTERIDDLNPSILKRILYSLLLRFEEKQSSVQVDKIVKEQLKKNCQKAKHKAMKKVFKSKSSSTLISSARKNLSKFMPMLITTLMRICLTL